MIHRQMLSLLVLVFLGGSLIHATTTLGGAFPGANGKLAFTSYQGGNTDVYTRNSDGSGETRLTTDTNIDTHPAVSPDGSKVVYATKQGGGAFEIYSMSTDGSGKTNLSNHANEDYEPTWSPDGTKIAFTTGRDGNAEIYVMNADGSAQTNVSRNPSLDARPDWGVVPGEKTLADLPPPAIGETANVDPSGRVLLGVHRRGATSAQKGVRFVALREARQIPVGTFVNTRRGRIRLQTAGRSPRGRQAGTFSGGLFQVLQSRRGRTRGLTSLRLKGSSFRRCAAAASGQARAAASIVRRLRGRAGGRFRTRGRHSAATVRGTTWVTVDRCDGTLTAVRRGRVVVRDFRRRRNILVRAGKSYLARR
jgi:hypothetical protein